MKRLFCVALLAACSETFPRTLGSSGSDSPLDAGVEAAADDASSDASSDASVDAPVVVGSTVDGEVAFPDAAADGGAGGNQTSVLLARVSDYELNGFYEKLPTGPQALGVTGAWSITGVPSGTYWVLAGYANDGFVSATAAPMKIEVSGATDEVVHAATQYLFRAIAFAGITPKASSASVAIIDVEGEEEYRVTVYDFMNHLVYSHAEPSSTATGTKLTFPIGAALTVPFRYRVRVVAMKGGVELTRTEDLAGVFTAQPDDT